jgi:hypothetical protein
LPNILVRLCAGGAAVRSRTYKTKTILEEHSDF